MKQALKYYVIIQKSAAAVMIHAFIPCFFTKYASDEIKNLSEHFAQK